MDFEEFCAAASSVPQLEGLDNWERQARTAYQIFDREANRVVVIEDLARVSYCDYLTKVVILFESQCILTLRRQFEQELGIPSSVPAHVVLHDWIRHSDGKLSFFGFTNLLRGMPPRSGAKPHPGR